MLNYALKRVGPFNERTISLLDTMMIWKFGAKQLMPLVREVMGGRGGKREQCGRLQPGRC